MNRNMVNVWDDKRRVSILEVKIGRSRLRARFEGKWRSYGTIINMKMFTMFEPSDKQIKVERPIHADMTAIVPTSLMWEVLPPGWWRKSLESTEFRASLQRLKYDEIERLKFIDSLQPKNGMKGKIASGIGCIMLQFFQPV